MVADASRTPASAAPFAAFWGRPADPPQRGVRRWHVGLAGSRRSGRPRPLTYRLPSARTVAPGFAGTACKGSKAPRGGTYAISNDGCPDGRVISAGTTAAWWSRAHRKRTRVIHASVRAGVGRAIDCRMGCYRLWDSDVSRPHRIATPAASPREASRPAGPVASRADDAYPPTRR